MTTTNIEMPLIIPQVLHHANNGTNFTGSGGRYPAFALLFWDTQGGATDLDAMPLDHLFANESVAVMRTDWTNVCHTLYLTHVDVTAGLSCVFCWCRLCGAY